MANRPKKKTGKEKDIDRRTCLRKKVHFGVNFAKIQGQDMIPKWADEVGVDIALDGCCCISSRKLPEPSEGLDVDLLLMFSHPHSKFLYNAKAKLIWQHSLKYGKQDVWYHGFFFERLNARTQNVIKKILK